jgi:hypothetical protein
MRYMRIRKGQHAVADADASVRKLPKIFSSMPNFFITTCKSRSNKFEIQQQKALCVLKRIQGIVDDGQEQSSGFKVQYY